MMHTPGAAIVWLASCAIAKLLNVAAVLMSFVGSPSVRVAVTKSTAQMMSVKAVPPSRSTGVRRAQHPAGAGGMIQR